MKDLNYQLGMMAGEYVVVTSLPTLSTDALKTRTIIKVSKELTEEWEQKEEDYYNKGDRSKTFEENRDWYVKNIEDVYLKPEMKVQIPKVEPTDLELFKEGFNSTLWNSDLSHYSYKEFQQTTHGAWCSNVILTRERE